MKDVSNDRRYTLRNSPLIDQLKDGGHWDEVMGCLSRGETMQSISDRLARKGIVASVSMIYTLKKRHLIGWEEERARKDLVDDGVFDDDEEPEKKDLEEVIARTLVVKMARAVSAVKGLDDLRVAMPLWAEHMRVRVSQAGEKRQAIEMERKLTETQTKAAQRIWDMLYDEDEQAKLRQIRDGVAASGGSVAQQVQAIKRHIWGDLEDAA